MAYGISGFYGDLTTLNRDAVSKAQDSLNDMVKPKGYNPDGSERTGADFTNIKDVLEYQARNVILSTAVSFGANSQKAVKDQLEAAISGMR